MQQENILIVVDPSQEHQAAVERAMITSKLRLAMAKQPVLKFFFGVDGQSVDTSPSNPQMYRGLDWFKAIVDQPHNEGIPYTTEICWSPDWSRAIVQSAKNFDASLIVFPDNSNKSTRSRLTDTKWSLLRHAKCPVLIVRPTSNNTRKVVLAAVRMQSDTEKYQELNAKILTRGKWMADLYGAEFHVVNAYADSMHYPDRAKILRAVDIPQEHVHVKQGPADEVVAEVAQDIGADIVVIGTMRRDGLLAAMRGNTSELLMSKVECDIMTLN